MEGIRRVLLLGGDTVNKLVNQSDTASAPLFGEAGFAAVLDLDEEAREMRYAFMTDGAGAKAIEVQHGGWLRMDGMDVFNFTINQVPNLINEQIADANLTADDIDYLVLHQANRFVLKNVGLATGFSTKKIPISMDRYGNTSTCSIPLTLCDMAIANPEMGNKTILMSGFGVGLSWGTIITKFDFSCCRGIVEI